MKRALSLILIFSLLLAACGCGSTTEELPTVTPTVEAPPENGLLVSEGVYLLAVGGYTGTFTEDGSDRQVENAVQIALKNISEKDIRLLYFTALDSQGRTLTFEVTTMPSGAKLACCEKDGVAYSEGLTLSDFTVTQVAYFEEPLTLYPETLQLMCADNTIEVKNISDTDYPGGRLHYKTVQDDIYVAGITYMLTIPAIAAGESVTLSSQHFNDESSRIVFIANAE